MARAPQGVREVTRTAALNPQPRGAIDTRNQSRHEQAAYFTGGQSGGALDGLARGRGRPERETPETPADRAMSGPIETLRQYAEAGGDITDLIPVGAAERIGVDAIREWRMDQGSRARWSDMAEVSLALAAQEVGEDDKAKEFPWDGASNVRYPLLTTAVQQFNARAYPELVKGDKAVSVKTFNPPVKRPTPSEIAAVPVQTQSPEDAQASQQQVQADQQQEAMRDLADEARESRANRVKHYLNFQVFYRMDNWEGETDLLLFEVPIIGAGFRKVYMGENGLCSDYVSATRLTVNNDTKSMKRCPRITHDFDLYPYEIEQRIRSGSYREVYLDVSSMDPEESRQVIEQLRLEDLDGDGYSEPYIVTVEVQTQRTLRIEPAYTLDDIVINRQGDEDILVRIDWWKPYATYHFLPNPRGRFYATGLGKLLSDITDAVDTSINQMTDAATAQVAGGGFLGAGVRLQGQGQGGVIYTRPGEYQVVSTPGPNLQEAIWERTVPHLSPVSFQLLELLLAAAKDISSVKDVITGESPATAPVGTTLALQNQALQVFSAIYKRIYRGFREEFQLMYQCLKRYATDRERDEYKKLTGGDLDEDFAGDGTDIQPIADPAVVTKMQKISRFQALVQLAESPVGEAAGMTQSAQAQAIAQEGLEIMDYDRPERFIGPIQPNPMQQAEVAEKESKAQLNLAQARHAAATANLDRAETVSRVGDIAARTHDHHREAARLAQGGPLAGADPMAPEGGEDGNPGQGGAPPAEGVGPAA